MLGSTCLRHCLPSLSLSLFHINHFRVGWVEEALTEERRTHTHKDILLLEAPYLMGTMCKCSMMTLIRLQTFS